MAASDGRVPPRSGATGRGRSRPPQSAKKKKGGKRRSQGGEEDVRRRCEGQEVEEERWGGREMTRRL